MRCERIAGWCKAIERTARSAVSDFSNCVMKASKISLSAAFGLTRAGTGVMPLR